MSELVKRHLVSKVKEALQTSRIVNIVGPRQSGKSTLVKYQLPIAEYLTMDSDSIRNSMHADAYAHLRSLADKHKATQLPIVLDEVQRLPEISLALKRIVDEDNKKGQFLLTGSADVFGLVGSGDSLAGRVHTLLLRPLSVAEINNAGPCQLLDAVEKAPEAIMSALPGIKQYSRATAIELILRGGYPEIRVLADRQRIERYSSYIDSIIIKDVPIVSPVRKPELLRRLIDQLAARTAQELNMSNLCNAVGARKETVESWVDTLERVCLVLRLPSWAPSAAKRAVHWPKLHFLDTGCAAALRNETQASFDFSADPAAFGAMLETFVHQELEKILPLASSHWRLAHWRSDNAEIDIVAECPGRSLALFEIKATSSVTQSDFKSIDWFLKDGPGKAYAARSVGFVVYLGDQLLTMGPNRICLPLSAFWSY
jgi:hypothetical protein